MKSWMISDWLTDLLIDDKIMIMITKSVIIPAVSGLYRPTGLLFVLLQGKGLKSSWDNYVHNTVEDFRTSSDLHGDGQAICTTMFTGSTL